MIDAIAFGHDAIEVQIAAQVRLAEAVGNKRHKSTKKIMMLNLADCSKKPIRECYDIAKQASSKADRGLAFSEVKML